MELLTLHLCSVFVGGEGSVHNLIEKMMVWLVLLDGGEDTAVHSP